MKTFQILVALSLTLFVCTSSFANVNALSPTSQLKKEVTKLVQNPELSKNGIKEADVKITFMINRVNEIVVLKVDTQNPYLETFIKEKLDNQKLDIDVPTDTNFNITFSFNSEL